MRQQSYHVVPLFPMKGTQKRFYKVTVSFYSAKNLAIHCGLLGKGFRCCVGFKVTCFYNSFNVFVFQHQASIHFVFLLYLFSPKITDNLDSKFLGKRPDKNE